MSTTARAGDSKGRISGARQVGRSRLAIRVAGLFACDAIQETVMQRLRDVGLCRAFWRCALATTLVILSTGCTEPGDPPGSGGSGVAGQCPAPLSYKQIKEQCNEAFTKCLGSRIQSIRSETMGHSLCHICRDECMQNQGEWPDFLDDGRPCR
jgi:hypothetical protein